MSKALIFGLSAAGAVKTTLAELSQDRYAAILGLGE
jgi:hypothetical protein